ncbi:MAG: hypothetical protein D3924_13380 [Candidatus Electrothrix sp. AR4]|nr:hypothetical protein [Candidatus Electrothrix sp. AR4]
MFNDHWPAGFLAMLDCYVNKINMHDAFVTQSGLSKGIKNAPFVAGLTTVRFLNSFVYLDLF